MIVTSELFTINLLSIRSRAGQLIINCFNTAKQILILVFVRAENLEKVIIALT